VHLGEASRTKALEYKLHIQRLLLGDIEARTADWLSEPNDTMYGRLANTGLVKPRAWEHSFGRVH
jgi:hypothetical protein